METFTTMITPYNSDGTVDYETALKYVDWYYQNGLDGIFSVCQSSEIFFLSTEERVKLAKTVYKRAKELEKSGNRPFTVVASGHVSDSFEEQVAELNAVWKAGCDALILITNRLDPQNEGDDAFIKNAERLIARLPADAKLGLYECPHPYKRLVTPKILDWCLNTGRFYYMKDTCCDDATLKARIEQLKGSHFKLLNANCQTLLSSVKNGGDGYCGIMCNFHPALYSWLSRNLTDPRADMVGDFLGTVGFIENGLPYPLTAKYSMNLCGIPTQNVSRVRGSEELTDYVKFCVRQLKENSDRLEKFLAL